MFNPVYIPLKLFRFAFYTPENCGIEVLISILIGLAFGGSAILVFMRGEKRIAEFL